MSVPPPLIDAATIADVDAAHQEARAAGDAKAEEVASLCRRAAASANQERLDEARASLARAMERTDDPRLLFLGFQFFFRTAVSDAATVDERTAGLQTSEDLVRKRLAIAEQRGDRCAVGRALTNLGLVLHYQRRYAEAEANYRRAVETDRGSADARGLIRSLGNLGNFYETRYVPASDGDLAAAELLYREAINAAQQSGTPQLACSPTANLGDLLATRGDRKTARLLWQRALDLSGEADVKVRSHCERRLQDSV